MQRLMMKKRLWQSQWLLFSIISLISACSTPPNPPPEGDVCIAAEGHLECSSGKTLTWAEAEDYFCQSPADFENIVKFIKEQEKR